MKKTKIMTDIAICTALAIVLSFFKLYEMPQGGSVSLAMVPILFISFKHGALPGTICGVIYGVLSVIFAGTIYHPMSVFLDYIAAFGVLGIAGIFGKRKLSIIAGSSAAIGGRFIFSVISGAVLFGQYAPNGQNPWIYSLIYQVSYMLPELILSEAVLLLIYTKANFLFEK